MTNLSVNINKPALLRNARGGNLPDLRQIARDCERFGAQGITVHPRPDERHIRYDDVYQLKSLVQTEYNIEGYPNDKFMKLMEEIKPHQCTLVPDPPEAITSSEGWDTVKKGALLKEVIGHLQSLGIRVSLFLEPDKAMLDAALECGTDRIEFYTGPYASGYENDREEAIRPYREAALYAGELKLGINAGHDLNLQNLGYFHEQIPGLLEVSIGHALWCDAIYYGLENVIPMYRRLLQ